MQCETCLGTGTVLLRTWPGAALQPYPCGDCGGSGLAHCCEGERPNEAQAQVHPVLDDADLERLLIRLLRKKGMGDADD